MNDASCFEPQGRYPSLPGDTGSAYDAPFMTSNLARKSARLRVDVAEEVILREKKPEISAGKTPGGRIDRVLEASDE
jgi:hypothetical protein